MTTPHMNACWGTQTSGFNQSSQEVTIHHHRRIVRSSLFGPLIILVVLLSDASPHHDQVVKASRGPSSHSSASMCAYPSRTGVVVETTKSGSSLGRRYGLLLAEAYNGRDCFRDTCVQGVAPFLIGFAVGAGLSIPPAIHKKELLDAQAAVTATAQHAYDIAHHAAEECRALITAANQQNKDLVCADSYLPAFQQFVASRCDANKTGTTFSSTTSEADQLAALKTTYDLRVYKNTDTESSSRESIQKLEYYTTTESYSCQESYQGECCTSSYSRGTSGRGTSNSRETCRSCTKYRSSTCTRTVRKSRWVHDYYRTTWVKNIQGGSAVVGGIGYQTNCGQFSSEWRTSDVKVVTSDVWDRTDKFNYRNTITSTTAIFLTFKLNGYFHLNEKRSPLVSKSDPFGYVASTNLGPFFVEFCPATLTATENVKATDYLLQMRIVNKTLDKLNANYTDVLLPEETKTGRALDTEAARRTETEDAYALAVGAAVGITVFGVPAAAIFIAFVMRVLWETYKRHTAKMAVESKRHRAGQRKQAREEESKSKPLLDPVVPEEELMAMRESHTPLTAISSLSPIPPRSNRGHGNSSSRNREGGDEVTTNPLAKAPGASPPPKSSSGRNGALSSTTKVAREQIQLREVWDTL